MNVILHKISKHEKSLESGKSGKLKINIVNVKNHSKRK